MTLSRDNATHMTVLGNVLESISGGGTPSRDVESYYEGSIPWVTIKDFHDQKYFYDSEEHITPQAVENSSTRIVPKNTVIIGARMAVGSVMITQVDTAINQDIKALYASKDIDVEYLYYWVQSKKSLMASIATGTTVKGIRLESLLSLPIPLPPLPEQRRIAEILGSVDAMIRNNTASKTKVLALREEALFHTFQPSQSNVLPLSEACSIESSLVSPKSEAYRLSPHVAPDNIESATGVLFGIKTCAEDRVISGKYTFDSRDVLYSKIRPYLRKVALPTFTGLCSADMYPLRPNTSMVTRQYLYFLLLSPQFTMYANSTSARTGIPKINREELFSYEFPLPSLEDQNRICQALGALDQYYGLLKRADTQLTELKSGLMKSLISHNAQREVSHDVV